MKKRLFFINVHLQILAYSLLKYLKPVKGPLQGFKTMFVLTPPSRQC